MTTPRLSLDVGRLQTGSPRAVTEALEQVHLALKDLYRLGAIRESQWSLVGTGDLTTRAAIGVGTQTPLGQMHIDQSSTTGAQAVLVLDQADVDEDFFSIIGTSDTSADRALVDAANFTTPGAIVGWLKIHVEDVQGTAPITDGDYFIPFYAAPTA